MPRYLITRRHTETYEIEIEAENENEAMQMAEDQVIDSDSYDIVDVGYYEYEVEEI